MVVGYKLFKSIVDRVCVNIPVGNYGFSVSLFSLSFVA